MAIIRTTPEGQRLALLRDLDLRTIGYGRVLHNGWGDLVRLAKVTSNLAIDNRGEEQSLADLGWSWRLVSEDEVQAPRFDLLRVLYRFIRGLTDQDVYMGAEYKTKPNLSRLTIKDETNIDDEYIYLHGLHTQEDAVHCGAVACGMGWAGLLPEFNKRGLYYTPRGGLVLNNEWTDYDEAAQAVLNITEEESRSLFYVVGDSWLDAEDMEPENGEIGIGRRCLLERIEKFFKLYDQPLEA